MFCINCGSKNVDVTKKAHNKVYVERGDISTEDGRFEEEFDATVYECSDCDQEMVKI